MFLLIREMTSTKTAMSEKMVAITANARKALNWEQSGRPCRVSENTQFRSIVRQPVMTHNYSSTPTESCHASVHANVHGRQVFETSRLNKKTKQTKLTNPNETKVEPCRLDPVVRSTGSHEQCSSSNAEERADEKQLFGVHFCCLFAKCEHGERGQTFTNKLIC